MSQAYTRIAPMSLPCNHGSSCYCDASFEARDRIQRCRCLLRSWVGDTTPIVPCAHIACVHHEDAPCSLCLIHNRTKWKMLLVQGNLQGLTAATKEKEGTQQSHPFHKHFLRERRDALLGGKGNFQLADFFGLQGDIVEGLQGDDLDGETMWLRS